MKETKYPEKIIALWTAFLLGTLFHTQLGLMPLFHGQSVAHAHDSPEATVAIFWLMLIFFLFPLLGIVLPLFWENQSYRRVHFAFTILYSVLNLLHLIADLCLTSIVWYQIFLMAVLLAIGLLLNFVAYQWLKARKKEKLYFGV
jgi:hypothetical protein